MEQTIETENRGGLRNILTLAWPTMLEQILQTAVQYIDTIMVGTLGTAATAAVGATTTVNWLIGSSISALGVGFLAYISQALGAKDRERARDASAQAVFVTLVVGVLFTVVTMLLHRQVPRWMRVDESILDSASLYFLIFYSPILFRCASILFSTVLRAAGDTRTPMFSGLIVNALNVVLNFFLIYKTRRVEGLGHSWLIPGAGWGVAGAAAASAVSFVAGGLLMTAALFHHREVSPLGHRFLPKKEVLAPCLKVALPNMAQRFCTSFGYVVFASMINSLGELSTAAHTVANTVESAFYVPGFGMQSAAATLTGNCIGAKDPLSFKKMARNTGFLEVGMMIVSGGLLFAFAPDLVSLFSKDPAVIALGGTVLRMVALSEPFYGLSIVTEGMLQGAGKTFVPFLFNVLCMWGVRILGTFLGIHFWNGTLIMAWGCMIANNLLLMLLFRLYYHFGRWNPLKTA